LAAEDDPIARQFVDESQLSDTELGTLLAAARPARPQHPASTVKRGVEQAARERQPRFTASSCLALLSALITELETYGLGGDPMLAVNALVRCDEPWPDEAKAHARRLLKLNMKHGTSGQPFAMLALARVGEGLAGLIERQLFRLTLSGIAGDEHRVLSKLDPLAAVLVAEVSGRSYYSPPQLPDAWERLAAIEGYVAFAQQAVVDACDRVDDIQTGKIPYTADGAFEKSEVVAIGRAVRLALHRDEPWLKDRLGELLQGVAVAPTKAKTLPSQALLYEIARAIEEIPTPEAAAALREANAVARHKGVHQQLARKLQRIGRALGDRADVALRVPELGFGADGVRVIAVGPAEAVLTLTHEPNLSWRRADGRLSATVPTAVRRDHPDAVKQIRSTLKEVRGHLTTLARSLEHGYTAEAVIPYGRWREELSTNGLSLAVIRRLIWEVPDPTGGWRAVLPTDDGFVDVRGTVVADPAPDAGIRLWHPLAASVEEIQAWRDLLTERELRQPFKQAFREVYLLTPAEQETSDYSNRFAGHVVHYRQLYALMKGLGWGSKMLGPWDSGDTDDAYRVLARGAWRVGFRHDYLDEPDGIVCASTDRVMFDRRTGGSWRRAPLADVPPIVFSEAMRDVDLLVSVTSIGADPSWTDRGADGRHVEYWREQSLADLTATAQVRRSALERLIPRTRIADRCELTDRYLVVKGHRNTYKIHLGSANILVEPGNTYLCIVPARRSPEEQVFVPFEDDRLTLILSKAFLLADDDRITDASILAQLSRNR
jgi:hypothetical protein